jgi:iron only hydrogenase large subunit-like protein
MIVSPELNQLLELISAKKEKLTAMLAPSFAIDFNYPEILGKLKRAGFSYTVEVARGALDTNKQVVEELTKDKSKRIITSPCPSCVRYIKAERPELVPYLSKADSPMTTTAKLVLQIFPGTRPVFIGPCLTKKLEAKEYPELKTIVITYKELKQLFETLQIKDSTEDLACIFDLLGPHTRLYPISGGLCQSAGIAELLTQEEYRMVSGIQNLKPALDEFVQDKSIRLLDILFCDGGCVNGPGIISSEPLDSRRFKVVKLWTEHPLNYKLDS